MPSKLTHEQWEPMDARIIAGRKISAIKLYREVTGEGLQEAKDAIDAREARLRKTQPEKFPEVAVEEDFWDMLIRRCTALYKSLFPGKANRSGEKEPRSHRDTK